MVALGRLPCAGCWNWGRRALLGRGHAAELGAGRWLHSGDCRAPDAETKGCGCRVSFPCFPNCLPWCFYCGPGWAYVLARAGGLATPLGAWLADAARRAWLPSRGGAAVESGLQASARWRPGFARLGMACPRCRPLPELRSRHLWRAAPAFRAAVHCGGGARFCSWRPADLRSPNGARVAAGLPTGGPQLLPRSPGEPPTAVASLCA